MIYKTYKPIGKTPLQSMNDFINNNGIKYNRIAYSGRLDPMAHGIFYIVTDEDMKNMSICDKHDKKYRFQVLLGVSTDTTDILGIITNTCENTDNMSENIKNNFLALSGKRFEQRYHKFSSFKTVYYTSSIENNELLCNKKKAMWEIFSDNNLKNINENKFNENNMWPKKDINIYNIDYIGTKEYGIDKLYEIIKDNLEKIDKDTRKNFRFEEILSGWNLFYFNNKNKNNCYKILEFDINVSSGTYIRQLVEDIKNSISASMLVIDIYRYDVYCSFG